MYSVIHNQSRWTRSCEELSIKTGFILPSIAVNNEQAQTTNRVVVTKGQTVELKALVQDNAADGSWLWSTGETTQKITIENVQNSGRYTLTYLHKGVSYPLEFNIYIPINNKPTDAGDYFIKHAETIVLDEYRY